MTKDTPFRWASHPDGSWTYGCGYVVATIYAPSFGRWTWFTHTPSGGDGENAVDNSLEIAKREVEAAVERQRLVTACFCDLQNKVRKHEDGAARRRLDAIRAILDDDDQEIDAAHRQAQAGGEGGQQP